MRRLSEWQFVYEVLGKPYSYATVQHLRFGRDDSNRDRGRSIRPQGDARVRHFARLQLQVLHPIVSDPFANLIEKCDVNAREPELE